MKARGSRSKHSYGPKSQILHFCIYKAPCFPTYYSPWFFGTHFYTWVGRDNLDQISFHSRESQGENTDLYFNTSMTLIDCHPFAKE